MCGCILIIPWTFRKALDLTDMMLKLYSAYPIQVYHPSVIVRCKLYRLSDEVTLVWLMVVDISVKLWVELKAMLSGDSHVMLIKYEPVAAKAKFTSSPLLAVMFSRLVTMLSGTTQQCYKIYTQ